MMHRPLTDEHRRDEGFTRIRNAIAYERQRYGRDWLRKLPFGRELDALDTGLASLPPDDDRIARATRAADRHVAEERRSVDEADRNGTIWPPEVTAAIEPADPYTLRATTGHMDTEPDPTELQLAIPKRDEDPGLLTQLEEAANGTPLPGLGSGPTRPGDMMLALLHNADLSADWFVQAMADTLAEEFPAVTRIEGEWNRNWLYGLLTGETPVSGIHAYVLEKVFPSGPRAKVWRALERDYRASVKP
jgi:hypothetical protein